jgi:hypothetical protein
MMVDDGAILFLSLLIELSQKFLVRTKFYQLFTKFVIFFCAFLEALKTLLISLFDFLSFNCCFNKLWKKCFSQSFNRIKFKTFSRKTVIQVLNCIFNTLSFWSPTFKELSDEDRQRRYTSWLEKIIDPIPLFISQGQQEKL